MSEVEFTSEGERTNKLLLRASARGQVSLATPLAIMATHSKTGGAGRQLHYYAHDGAMRLLAARMSFG